MDDVNFGNCLRSEFFETDDRDDYIHCSSSTIADTLDLAVQRPTSTDHVRPLERLSGRWTFRSMPQDVNLAAYGKQFSGEWPSFHVEIDCGGSVVNAKPTFALAKDSANEDTQDDGTLLPGADGHNSSVPSCPNTFTGQCAAFVGRVFTWDFYRAVCLFFLPIVTLRNRR